VGRTPHCSYATVTEELCAPFVAAPGAGAVGLDRHGVREEDHNYWVDEVLPGKDRVGMAAWEVRVGFPGCCRRPD
jgi:hypothetical protein